MLRNSLIDETDKMKVEGPNLKDVASEERHDWRSDICGLTSLRGKSEFSGPHSPHPPKLNPPL